MSTMVRRKPTTVKRTSLRKSLRSFVVSLVFNPWLYGTLSVLFLMPRKPRRTRSDADTIVYMERDDYALPWIGQMKLARLDHIRQLLGRFPGAPTKEAGRISEGAARDVVNRWKKAGWVRAKRIRVGEPFYVWLTPAGLRKVGLPYKPLDIESESDNQLKHLVGLVEVRLHVEQLIAGGRWVSERQLQHGMRRSRGERLGHCPDAEIHVLDGRIFSVELERSPKGTSEMQDVLLRSLKGEPFDRVKQDLGREMAYKACRHIPNRYAGIWYFAASASRKEVKRAKERLVEQGTLTEEEAKAILVFSYPLVAQEWGRP